MTIKRIITYFLVYSFFMLFLSFEVFSQDEEKATIPLDHFYAKPQEGSGFRKFMSKLNFSFETGYGRTYYRQNMEDFAVLQRQSNSTALIFDRTSAGSSVPVAYEYFFNDASSQVNVPFNNADFLVSGDTSDLKFRAPGHSIPLSFMIHMKFQRYKIGFGTTFEYHRPGTFQPSSFEDQLNPIEPDFKSTFFKKYFLILGAAVYRYNNYLVSADARIGAFNLGGEFNKSLIDKGIYVNIGATIERELSEYFKAYIRPSFDLKNYTLNLPESDQSITTNMNAFYVNVGVTYRIPELPKCFLKKCTIQINHQHGNSREYRSRMHPIYKKQNPHHGENFPRLFKYKKKNKKKLHAY